MKRIVALALLAALLITFCGCGKVRQAEQAIAAIGTVSPDSGEKIEAAEAAVGSLNERQKENLENLAVLEQAQSDYAEAIAQQTENEALVAEAEARINEIGEVTLESGEAIREARSSYAAIDPEYQADVANAEALALAEADYLELAINAVTEAIAAIGDVTLDSAEAVAEARALYDSFPGAVQSQVANRDVLVQDEALLSALRVQDVIAKIEAIGDVTLSSEDLIREAERAFARLTEDEQSNVFNAAQLLTAREDYDALEAAARELVAAEEARGILRVTGLELRAVDDGAWGVELAVTFENRSEQAIGCIYYEATAYGADGQALAMTDDEAFDVWRDEPISSGETATDARAFWLEAALDEVAQVVLTALSVEFADGSVYTFTENQIAAVCSDTAFLRLSKNYDRAF